MGVSLAEAVTRLMAGAKLSWQTFEQHKAGAIALTAPGQRRLFQFLIKQPSSQIAEGNEKLFAGLHAAWADETRDPASAENQYSSAEFTGPWRLDRIESSNFGGLNNFNGPVFDLHVGMENWCLEGQNGAGKTSLIGAVIWALTGQRIREQEGLADDEGRRAPVFDDKGMQIGTWPPLVAYPADIEDLKADATVWTRLTFKDDQGNTAVAFRKVHCSAGDATPVPIINVDPRLMAVPQLIETGLLMPARLPRVGFGDRSHSLYEAVKLLTGLDQLSNIAEGAAIFTHGTRRFLKYAKDQGIERQKTKFDESIAKAEVKALEVAFDISALKTLGQKNVSVSLRNAAQEASDQAGEHLAKLKAEIAPGIDTTKVDDRAKVKRGVASARAILGQGTKGISAFEAWAALRAATEDTQFKKLPDALTSSKEALSAALVWHRRQIADQKFRLKALASQYYVVPSGDVAGECPLCAAELISVTQQNLAAELADLKKDAEAAERKLDDVCAGLEKMLSDFLPADVKKHFDALAIMEPRSAYAAAVQERFSSEPPFSDVHTGISTSCMAVVAEQTKKLPKFNFKEFSAAAADLPAAAAALLQRIHLLERTISLASWWSSNRQPFRDDWIEVLGKKDEDGKWPASCIEGQLSALEEAIEKAEPLDDLSKYLVAAAEANEAWEKIQEVQTVREAIAKALEPLKDLRLLVAAETARSIAALGSKIKAILDRIHLRERLAYENASLGKKAVRVEGSFEPGMQIDAALVANSSWLKAILWAFVLALREQTIEGLNANPFPLVILDDPQMTFDPRNKRKWAEELARLANLDTREPLGMQLFLTTHERQFFQCLVNHEKLAGQQGLIAAINKISGVATIVNGCSLERGWNDAKANNDDALARKYISDVRVYCEDLLKFMLRGEGPHIASLSLDGLKQELKRLQEGAVVPFNRRAFVDLRNTLDGGGGKSMKLINESHHRDDGTIGLAEAEDVKKVWDGVLQKQISTAFHVFAEYEAHYGDPRTFTWEKNVVELPTSQNAEIKKLALFRTGVAAAAKSDGRAGDGLLTIEEWATAKPLTLPNHEIYQLTSGTLDPVAGIGDLIIVSNYAKVNERNLVVVAFGDRLLARRYNFTDAHPDIIVLTGQSVDPYNLVQPVIAPREGLVPHKIVGTIFASHLHRPPALDPNSDFLPLPNASLIQDALQNARLFEVKGRSAEPIALESQFLITHPVTFDEAHIRTMEGRLVVAVDEHGGRYFKRLRLRGPLVVLESLNPDGTTPAELLSVDGTSGLPTLTGLLEVRGILFELPT